MQRMLWLWSDRVFEMMGRSDGAANGIEYNGDELF
jgi:hypothetical protein